MKYRYIASCVFTRDYPEWEKGPEDRYIILLYSIRGMACVSYHGMMISLPEIFDAKRLIFIEKNVKNAIKTISGGLLYENLVVQSY